MPVNRLKTVMLTIALLTLSILLLLPGRTAAQEPETLRIVTWNIEWFFDHNTSDDNSRIGRDYAAPDRGEYQERVKAVAAAIQEIDPAILALQEVENEKVVADVARRLATDHDLEYQVAFVQGRDSYTGQDVAFLVKEDILFDESRLNFRLFSGDDNFKSLSKHLKLDVILGDEAVTLITVHLVTGREGRVQQARTLRAWIEESVAEENLILLGDFNAGQRFNQTTPDSDIGIIRGFQTDTESDDLFDTHRALGDRATHVSNRELDRILISPALLDETGLQFVSVDTRRDLAIRGSQDRGDGVAYQKPTREQDLSDHYPLVATFALPGSEAPKPPVLDQEGLKAELLAELERIEAELTRLTADLEDVRSLIEALEE